MQIGPALILLAAILFGVGMLLRRVRPDKKAILAAGDTPPPPSPSLFRRQPPPAPDPDVPTFQPPRPPLAAFDVDDRTVTVTFAVPIPPDGDEVLTDVLVGEAIETIRERRHTEPLPPVDTLVVRAGIPATEIDRRPIPDGNPAESGFGTSMLNLSSIALDPLQVLVDQGPGELDLPVRTSGDEVRGVGGLLRLPRAVETGLRAQGIDPASMTAGQLVTGMLALVGYTVTPGVADHTYFAQKGTERTFIRVDPPAPDGHPEVGEEMIQRFLFEFQSAQTDRGLFVSDKYAPFGVFDKEAREPRIRFLTRERLQKFVDGLALG